MTKIGLPHGLRVGAALAVAILALDQACKFYLFHVMRLSETRPIPILPFLDLSFVWNYGISYGLFQQDNEIGRWILVGLSLAAVVLIFLWLWRTRSLPTALALGLIAGGALGNALDRALYGAVMDFLHLHGGAVRWLDFPYLFNVADAAISLGVVLLVGESMFAKRDIKRETKRGALEPDRDPG